MKSNFIIVILTVAVIVIISTMALQTLPQRETTPKNPLNGYTATIHKSPYCGCCGQYATYLNQQGYSTDTKNLTNMRSIKEKFDVPYELESCHTMEIDGYVVEGHVPKEAVDKLLAKQPDIKGIGMAGMPSGSPGMPGPKNSDFVIYTITHSGTKGDIFMTI